MSRVSTSRSSSGPLSGASTLGLMTGSPASAIKRGKGKLSRTGSNAGSTAETPTASEAAGAAPFEEEDTEPPVLTRKEFGDLRADTLDETISEAGSDEDEVIPEDEEYGEQEQRSSEGSRLSSKSRLSSQAGLQQQVPSRGDYSERRTVGEIDRLTMLRENTPMTRLRMREKEAKRVKDPWLRVRLRQEILGIAKLYSATGPYRAENEYPMLVAEAHFNLAKAYADAQCAAQATDHCKKALESMQPVGGAHIEVVEFEEKINVMQAEMLLLSSPPKPQAALQYILMAGKCENAEDIVDPGWKVLAAQCYMLMGNAKLQEVYATKHAVEALQQRVDSLTAKQADLERRNPEYERTVQRIRDTRNELAEEEAFQGVLVQEAHDHIDKASDVMNAVILQEEDRVKAKMKKDDEAAWRKGVWKKHPLVVGLRRQGCEIMFKLSIARALAGQFKQQLVALDEILSNHTEHECVPTGLLARVYKERGAALVMAAASANDDPDDRETRLQHALESYYKLLELQDQRYPDDPNKQLLLRAEALKLIGNVYIARRTWNKAEENFREALEIYEAQLGSDSHLVQDLEHRLAEVKSYSGSA